MRLYRFIAVAVLLGFLPQATYAQAIVTKPISELPKPTLVQENRAMLLERGCVEVVAEAAAQTVAQPADKPVLLYPNDWTVGKYVFCPEAVKNTVTVKEGKVKAFPILFILAGILITAYFFVPGVSDAVQSAFFWIVRTLLYWGAVLGVLVVYYFSDIVDNLLIADNFTTSSFVRTGWPFLQGIANIGFIIALLYIAILTVLRMSSGLGKLIPKLILGALLINFSLVIGGVLIDASRVVMAAERRLLGSGTPGIPIGIGVLSKSEVIDQAFDLDIVPFRPPQLLLDSQQENDVSSVLDLLFALVLIWVLLVGMFMVGIGLFTRYIGLILLLIVSPIAYVALGIPNLSGLAMKWWQMFLKFVIYGPVALFILLLMRLIPRVPLTNHFGTDSLAIGTAVGLMWAMATVAKSYSLAGADKVLGLAKGAAGFAKRHPVLTGAAVIGATGGVGALALGAAGYFGGKGAAKVATTQYKRRMSDLKEFRKAALRSTREHFGLGEFSDYDDEGKLKKGKSSWAKRLGQRIGDPDAAAANRATHYNDPAISLAQLTKGRIRQSLSEDALDSIFDPANIAALRADVAAGVAGAQGRLDNLIAKRKALIQDIDVVDNMMSATHKSEALADSETRDAMTRALRQISQREEQAARKS